MPWKIGQRGDHLHPPLTPCTAAVSLQCDGYECRPFNYPKPLAPLDILTPPYINNRLSAIIRYTHLASGNEIKRIHRGKPEVLVSPSSKHCHNSDKIFPFFNYQWISLCKYQAVLQLPGCRAADCAISWLSVPRKRHKISIIMLSSQEYEKYGKYFIISVVF